MRSPEIEPRFSVTAALTELYIHDNLEHEYIIIVPKKNIAGLTINNYGVLAIGRI